MTVYIATGATERIEALALDSAGAAVTGATLKITVWRASDGFFLDFSTSGFTATPVTLQATLTEHDSTRNPGGYYYSLVTGGFVSPVANDKYLYRIDQTAGTAAINLPSNGELRAGGFVDTIASNLNATVGSRAIAGDAMTLASGAVTATAIGTGYVAAVQSGLATASALTTAQTDLTAIKGSGFVGGTDDMHSAHTLLAATATAAALTSAVSTIDGHTDTALASLQSHGDSTWSTAIGFAVPGSAMALTSGERLTVQALVLSDATPFQGARIDATITSRLASGSYTSPPSAAAISTQVAADLASAHGAGSWATATGFAVAGDAMTLASGALLPASIGSGYVAAVQSGLATSSALASLQTHGDSTWSTATSVALTAGALTSTAIGSGYVATIQAGLSAPSAAANAAAVWATAEGGTAGTALAALSLIRRRTTNRRSLASSGVLSYYADDQTTVETTVTITDVTGSAISLAAGEPARSTAET